MEVGGRGVGNTKHKRCERCGHLGYWHRSVLIAGGILKEGCRRCTCSIGGIDFDEHIVSLLPVFHRDAIYLVDSNA